MKFKKIFSCLMVALILSSALAASVYATGTAYYSTSFRKNGSYSTASSAKSIVKGTDVQLSYTAKVTTDANTSANNITFLAAIRKGNATTYSTLTSTEVTRSISNSSSSMATTSYYTYCTATTKAKGNYYVYYKVSNATKAYYFDTTLRFYVGESE